MQRSRPIREKLVLCALLLGVMVVALSASSFVGIYSYRRLVRALSCRAAELPRASALDGCVAGLRLAQARGLAGDESQAAAWRETLREAHVLLDRYRDVLDEGEIETMPFGDRSRERATAGNIASSLDELTRLAANDGGRRMLAAAAPHLERLSSLTAELPTFLQDGLHDLSREVRSGYHTLIFTTSAAALAAAALLAAIAVVTYRWIFRPLRLLGHGSRRVAAGDFGYRIRLDTRDEMAELADALNDMTERFQEIRDDLDRQVQLRTREVIRSEQLASVGFLAAGVAHEINNPLASIAMCAESLESRLGGMHAADAQVASRYLELIQTEAFRCKGITEKLLDFSRLGEVRRQATALVPLVDDVAEMLRHVGRFAGRTIEIAREQDAMVMANPQEIKQVVLNLLVNALDSIEHEGRVRVEVRRGGGEGVLIVTDDGCGMTDEVLEHLFEPFFTRRRAGQGTGLGLSIVQRIVADHGGRIEATSAGPGQGTTFRVRLPLAEVGRASTAARPRDMADKAAKADKAA
ncbi:MAG: sensor histidine kinase [Planctomycetia bacterium]